MHFTWKKLPEILLFWKGKELRKETKFGGFVVFFPSSQVILWPLILIERNVPSPAWEVLFPRTYSHFQLQGHTTSFSWNDHFFQLAKFCICGWRVEKDQAGAGAEEQKGDVAVKKEDQEARACLRKVCLYEVKERLMKGNRVTGEQ